MTRLLAILLALYLFSCRQKAQQVSDTDISVEDGIDTIAQHDRHKFYEDLPVSSADSLERIISESDKVIAYNWNDKDLNPANVYHYIVDAYGNFDERIADQLVLNKQQISDLSALLTDTSNFSGNLGVCFIPHIAFVYYCKDSIIGQSNVCFLCAGVKSIPKTKKEALSQTGNIKFKDFCKSIGLTIVDQAKE